METASSVDDGKAAGPFPPELEKATSKNTPMAAADTDDNTLAILELVKAQDAHHPIHWPAWKRWSIITVYCFLQLFVTMTSTSYREFLSELSSPKIRKASGIPHISQSPARSRALAMLNIC
jgi:hypothetical protein